MPAPFEKKPLDNESADAMRINLSVRNDKLSPEPVCDVCGDKPSWVYASDLMSTGEQRKCWRWAVCDTCSGLIDKEDIDSLARRVVKRAGAGPSPSAWCRS